MIRCDVVEVRIDYRAVAAAQSEIYLEVILEEPLVEELVIAHLPPLRRGERDIFVLIFPLYIVAVIAHVLDFIYAFNDDNLFVKRAISQIHTRRPVGRVRLFFDDFSLLRRDSR